MEVILSRGVATVEGVRRSRLVSGKVSEGLAKAFVAKLAQDRIVRREIAAHMMRQAVARGKKVDQRAAMRALLRLAEGYR